MIEDLTRADLDGFVAPLVTSLQELGRRAGVPVKFRLCDTMGFGLPWPEAALPRGVPRLVQFFTGSFGVAPVRHQANNLERGKMLPDVRGLLQRQFRLPFHDKSVEILGQKKRYRFGKRSHNADFHLFHRVKNSQLLVLKDRICVQDEESGSHNY